MKEDTSQQPKCVESVKTCPYLDKPCIVDKCAKYVQMHQANRFGGTQQVGMCAEVAVTLLLSTLIQTMTSRPQKIQLPNLKGG